jgi:hypothetical protein
MNTSLQARITLGAQGWAAATPTPIRQSETVRDSKGYLTEVWTINGKVVTPKD